MNTTSPTSSGMFSPENYVTSTMLDNGTVCLSQENNAVRTVGIIVSVIAVVENIFLLIAMIIYWPKFLSNLYRFVASLICADLMVASFNICLNILKFYDSTSEVIAFFKGSYTTMHMVSTFSVSLVNASVFFTYSRFTTRLLEQQMKNAENKHTSRIRKYFRKPPAAYVTICGVWAIGLVYLILAVVTRCTTEMHNCFESCSTVVRRHPYPGESGVCESPHCNKFLAPLSSYYTLSVIVMFWVSFIFLIGSTMTVVFVKVEVTIISGTSDNSGFQNDDDDDAKITSVSPSVEEDAPKDAEASTIAKHSPSNEISTNSPERKKATTNYVIKRKLGFNRDLMSRFSLLITVTQLVFWMPVTGIILYTLVQNQAFTSFYNYEIMMVYFGFPTIVNPWICVLTMSKLRDAIFRMYYSICH